MKQVQLFLIEIAGSGAFEQQGLFEAISQLHNEISIARLVIEPDVLDGTDTPIEALLEEVRAAGAAAQTISAHGHESSTEQQSIVLGVGLAGSVALWMGVLDKIKPREFSSRNASIALTDAPPERGPALAGVIAVNPLLGLDFSLQRSGPISGQALSEWAYRLSGLPGVGGFFRGIRTSFRRYGYQGLPSASWGEIRKCLPFPTVVKFLPSLKRPTVMLFDHPLSEDSLSIRLGSLNSRVSVIVSETGANQRVQAILRAVDRITKGT